MKKYSPTSAEYVQFFFITILLSLLLLLCGPKPAEKSYNVPYNLSAIGKDRSAMLKWKVNRNSDLPISGYNIYLANSPDDDGELINSAPYPGDIDGDVNNESYELERLTNGKAYHAFVRTVFTDGKLSRPSKNVSFIPLAQGRIKISQNHTTAQSGYSFSQSRLTPARDFDNDFYIYSANDKKGISSPSRLHSSLHKTLFKIKDGSQSSYSQTQSLVIGNTYQLKIADGGIAELKLIKLIGEKPNITAVFDYIYYPPGIKPR